MLLDIGPLRVLLFCVLPLLATTSLNNQIQEAVAISNDWKQLRQAHVDETLRNDCGSWNHSDNNTVTNVTVQLGGTAFLHCRVPVSSCDKKLASPEHVSWIRRRDWEILSAGILTFTNDKRFKILHQESSDSWTLQIKYVQIRDGGTYECQISSVVRGVVSRFINLQIVVPEAFIQGSTERHVDLGSNISLVCIIDKSPTPPQYVFWFHNSRMINYDMARGGITVETEPGMTTRSLLTIQGARDADTGNYTCTASNTQSASIYVYVQEGDKMASLRRKNSSPNNLNYEINLLLMTILINLFR